MMKEKERKNAAKSKDPIGFREKQAKAMKEYRENIEKNSNEEVRRKCFLKSIQLGRIFECICCHRKGFQTSVLPLPFDFAAEYKKSYPQIYSDSIGDIETKPVDGKFYWCKTCKSYIMKNKIPPMSNQNSLNLFDFDGYDGY